MLDTLAIGPTPAEEDCAQVGDKDYTKKAVPECRRFAALIVQKLGPPPGNARLRLLRNAHDFGTYYEIGVEFDSDSKEETQYAYLVEALAPKTWDDTTPPTEEEKEEALLA